MNNLSVRKLNVEDAKALNDFFKSLSREDKRLVIEDDEDVLTRSVEQDSNLIIKQSNTGFLAGVFNDNNLIALATITYFNHIDFLTSISELGIVVLDKFKRKGIGSQLLKFIITEAKKDKKKTIELNVLESNKKAINFYIKHGFKMTTTSDEASSKNKTIFMSLYI